MDELLRELFHYALERTPEMSRFELISPYFQRIEAVMGREFTRALEDAEFQVSQEESFASFSQGFRLAFRLMGR